METKCPFQCWRLRGHFEGAKSRGFYGDSYQRISSFTLAPRTSAENGEGVDGVWALCEGEQQQQQRYLNERSIRFLSHERLDALT